MNFYKKYNGINITELKNNRIRVKKKYYKNQKISAKVQVKKKGEYRKVIKELSYYENSQLIKKFAEKGNQYIYHKRLKKCRSKFYFFHIISYLSKTTKYNLCKGGFSLRFRHLNKYMNDFICFFFNKKSLLRLIKKKKRLRSDKTLEIRKSIEQESITSFIFPKIDEESIIIGNKNIIFPGCSIIAEKGKIFIGHNNLFEDNVTILNKTHGNMYIGNFNIFRSGTYVLNCMNIGDDNYFDYKCFVKHTNISSRCFIGIHTRISDMLQLEGELKIIDNYISNTDSYFFEDNRKEIQCRYKHLLQVD